MALDAKYYRDEATRYLNDKKIYLLALKQVVHEAKIIFLDGDVNDTEKMITSLCKKITDCDTQVEYCVKRINELNAEGK